MKVIKILKYTVLILLFPSIVFSAILTVGTGKTYDPAVYGTMSGATNAACADANDGDTIQIKNGLYPSGFSGVNCSKVMTAESYIEPETPGGVTITHKGVDFTLQSYWHLRNFIFDMEGSDGDNYVIKLPGANTKVTNNMFLNFNSVEQATDGAQRIISIGYVSSAANYVEIKNNLFERTDCLPIEMGSSDGKAKHWLISHNHFKDILFDSSDSSAMVLGSVNAAFENAGDMDGVVEYNLFEDVRADDEAISVKSTDVTFRFNVFLNSNALSFRHGHNSVAYKNLFISTVVNRGRGITVYGSGHKIINNHFESIGDYRGIWLHSSNQDATWWRTSARNILIAHNSFINIGTRDGVILFATTDSGYIYDACPTGMGCTFINNIIQAGTSPYFIRFLSHDSNSSVGDVTWTNNVLDKNNVSTLCQGTYDAADCPSGQIEGNPSHTTRLVQDYGTIKVLPPVGSIALSAGTDISALDALMHDDYDSENRTLLAPDIGSDEYSSATVFTNPIPKGCVGPVWSAYYDCGSVINITQGVQTK